MIAVFDYGILVWFQSIQSELLTQIFKGITTIGEGGIIWIVVALILVVCKQTRKIGVTILLALLFSLIIGNLTLKPLIARPRPSWRNPDVILQISNPTDYSFPSGHTLSSFAAAFGAFLWNRKWGFMLLFVAVLMGITRLYFYVHYPTDVLGGAGIGLVLGAFSYSIVKKMWRRWEERR